MDWHQQKEIEENHRKNYIKNTKAVAELIGAIPICPYTVDITFDDVAYTLERYSKREGGLLLNPDFQRGHVWTNEQPIAYIENVIRGVVGDTGRTITFNCSDFQRQRHVESDIVGFYVVDGLQRLTAVQKFMNGEFKIFAHINGGVDKNYFNGTAYRIGGIGLKFNVFNMQYKKDLLDYYLTLNSGGTVHSKEEIERVQKMRDEL